MARMASSYALSWSKWNNQKHTERSFLFRAKQHLDWNDDDVLIQEDVQMETNASETSSVKSEHQQEPTEEIIEMLPKYDEVILRLNWN
jgi:hypothetical protein